VIIGGRVDTVLFDKTGTLTEDFMVLERVVSALELSQKREPEDDPELGKKEF
jgi:magnesium-transporting ATPase (P-type)